MNIKSKPIISKILAMDYFNKMLGYEPIKDQLELFSSLFEGATEIVETSTLNTKNLETIKWAPNSKHPTLSSKTICILNKHDIRLAAYLVLAYLYDFNDDHRDKFQRHNPNHCDHVLLKYETQNLVFIDNLRTKGDKSGFTFVFDLSRVINIDNPNKALHISKYLSNCNDDKIRYTYFKYLLGAVVVVSFSLYYLKFKTA